jgi:hypothetical protein
VPVHIARSRNGSPIYMRVSGFQVIRQATGGFGDDLQSSCDCIDRLSVRRKSGKVETGYENSDRCNIVKDVAQAL